MNKLEEILTALKERDLRKKSNPVAVFLAVVGVIALIAGIAYLLYRHFVPDYLEDLEEDFDDDFEDYFEEEDGEQKSEEE